MKLGKHSTNMARDFNYREGFTYKNDTLSEVFFYNFKSSPINDQGAINKTDFQNALRLCYELMGWDVDTGIPTPVKLIELGLDWLINEVK